MYMYNVYIYYGQAILYIYTTTRPYYGQAIYINLVWGHYLFFQYVFFCMFFLKYSIVSHIPDTGQTTNRLAVAWGHETPCCTSERLFT